MNIVYFAGGNRLETLMHISMMSNITIKAVCVASIENQLGLYEKFSKENNIPFFVFNKSSHLDQLKKIGSDLLLSVGYRYIIPKSVYAEFTYAINIHPTLLPKYRGAYSGYAVIENGESETGLTAHFLDEGIDTGDIIHQIKIPITKFDLIKNVSEKIAEKESGFVADVLEKILSQTFHRRKQPNSDNIVLNSKRKPEDSKLDETKPLIALYDKIRACDPEKFPAYIEIQGRKIEVKLEFK